MEIDLKKVIEHQASVYEDRINRGKVIESVVGNLNEGQIAEAAGKGMIELHSMTKEQIIRKMIDNIDLIMIGLFTDSKEKYEKR